MSLPFPGLLAASASPPVTSLALWDWVVIALYALTIGIVGFVLVRKSRTAEGYFLAGRSLTWPLIGGSLFAANISAEHIVGLAGSGYQDGMAVGGFEWMAIYCMVPLILLFLPFYVRNKIFTVPEFLEQRFDHRVRMFFSALMVVLAVLVKISISLWASAIFFHDVLGWNQTLVIWSVGLFTALYTMKGGLRVVVYTDALQSVILLGAAVVLTYLGLREVGGWSGLQERLEPGMLEMVKPLTHNDYPWFGMFFGVFVLGSFYWSMDQVLVQRAFAAKDLNEGRLGVILCGFLKLTTPFLLILPGLIAKAYLDVELPPGKSDHAYPELLQRLMPEGLLGLTFAGITAALMGHLSATYNSVATLVTRDFYLYWRPQASQERQVFVGRVAVLGVCVLGALWAPVIGALGNLWIYLQQVQSYLMMPLAGIFFAGIFWKRTTSPGVIACFLTTCLVSPIFWYNGFCRKIENGIVTQPGFLPFLEHPVLRPWLHSACLAFAVCMAVLVAVSLFTRPASAEQLRTTTVSDWRSLLAAPRVPFYRHYLFWLAVLLTTCTALYYTMR